MANKYGEIRRSDNGVNIYISPEERDQLDAVCDYMGISRSKFLRITVDAAYNRICMGNLYISPIEIADRHNVGYGIVMDLCNLSDD